MKIENKKSKTRKFIVNFIIFIFILCAILISLECIIYTNDDGPAGWAYVYNGEIDVLIMGSSHVYCSIDTPYINDNLNKNTVALAEGCQNAEMAYFNLIEVLKYQKPDIIILEAYSLITDVLSDTEGTDLDVLIRRNLDGMVPSFNKYYAAISMLGINSYTVFEVFRKDNSDKLFQFIKNPHKTKLEDISLNPIRGYVPMTNGHHFSEKDFNNRFNPVIDYSFELPENNTKYFKKILKLCTENGIHLEIVKVPVLETIEYTSGCIAIEKYLQENNYNIPVINLSEETYHINLLEEDYFDRDHLNKSGAKKVSIWFVEYLNSLYESKIIG